jgi:hypothetical protein
LDLVERITQFNDSTFFGRIQDIEVSSNGILLSDQGTNQIHVIDRNLNYIKSFGQSGSGPGEIKGVSNIGAFNKKIFVHDLTNGKILKYDRDNKFVEQFKINITSSEFGVSEDKVVGFSSSNSPKHPLSFIDLYDSLSIEDFGIESSPEMDNPSQHVLVSDNYIISAYEMNGLIINTYNLKGDFLATTDFSNHPNLKVWFNNLNIQSMIAASTANVRYAQGIFYDAVYFQNRLYLNLPNIGGRPEKRKSVILECKMNADFKFEIKRIFELKDHFPPPSFSIIEDGPSIILYDPVFGAIEKFLLPKL